MKSKSKSSSSSGSVRLMHDHQIQNCWVCKSPLKDLFDQLLEQNYQEQDNTQKMIEQLNLSPRGNTNHNFPGCKCTKIDCLKMYCQCFSKGRTCNPRCSCYSCQCHNRAEFHDQIYRAQQLANFKHPNTFQGVPAWVPLKRCTCKKSQCKKNYCDCFRAGLKCTQQCQCLDCQNGKPHNHFFQHNRMEIQVQA